MKSYYISSDDHIDAISYEVNAVSVLIGEGTTSEIDLKNSGYACLGNVLNPKVYENRYNKENREMRMVWQAPNGKYRLWLKVRGAGIYFADIA